MPSRFILTGQVQASQAQRKIHSDYLEIELASSTEGGRGDAPGAPGPPDLATLIGGSSRAGSLRINGMTAKNGVQAQLDEPHVRLTAQQLVVDPQLQQVELSGGADDRAEIFRPDGYLSGDRIVINQRDRSVHVAGPGSFMFLTRGATPSPTLSPDQMPSHLIQPQPPIVVGDAHEPLGDSPQLSGPSPVHWVGDGDPSDAGQTPDRWARFEWETGLVSSPRVEVTWTRAMHFDDRQGLAHFVGGVMTNGRFDEESVRLAAEDIRIEFLQLSPTSSSPAQKGSDHIGLEGQAPRAGGSSLADLAESGRAVSSVVAGPGAVFLAEKRSPDVRGSLETRLRVTGPMIVFDNALEQIQVIGSGSLLMEDYRPTSQARPSGSGPSGAGADGGRASRIGLLRRGVTLATWNERMVLDAVHNDMQMEDRVQILHRPPGGDEPMQIDCQRLVVDLEATGGLGAWLSGNAPQPQVKGVYAYRDVRLLSDTRSVFTDRLSFTGFDQVILLKADPGRLTQIHDRDRPNALTAQQFQWDLARNRIEIIHPGGGRMPVQ